MRITASGAAVARDVTLPGTVEKMGVFLAAAANVGTVSLKVGSTTKTFTPGVSAIIFTDGTINGLEAFYLPASVVDTLTDLTDFPANYVGAALKLLRVNAGATAVEFHTQILDDTNDVNITSAADGDALVWDSTPGEWVNQVRGYDIGCYAAGVMTNAEIFGKFVAPRSFRVPSGAAGSYGKATTAATGSTTVTAKKNGSAVGTFVWAAAGTTATITWSSDTDFIAGDVLTLEGPATADATLAGTAITIAGKRLS
jgi:hypothetical protein